MKKILLCIAILNILLSISFFIISKSIFYFSLYYIEGIYWILVWYFLLLNIFVIIYSSKKIILKILFFQFTFLLIFISFIMYLYEIEVLVENIKSVKNLDLFVEEIVFFISEILKKEFTILFIIELIFLVILRLNFKDMRKNIK